MKTPLQNISKPAPRWFRIARPVIADIENLVIAIWMMYQPADSQGLLIFKLVSSFVKTQLERILASETERYAKKFF